MIIYDGFMVVCERCGSEDVEAYDLADKGEDGLPLQMTMKDYANERINPRPSKRIGVGSWSILCKTCGHTIRNRVERTKENTYVGR